VITQGPGARQARIGAKGLEDPHCPRGANTMAVQEDHDFAHGLLFAPGGENAGRTAPMPSTSRSQSGELSMTSKTFSPNARTSFLA
jgi:hypothetical protein